MAVAYGASTTGATTTGATIVSGSLAITGSNLVIMVEIEVSTITATVSSVVWSLGSGTPVEVKAIKGGSAVSVFSSIWAVPAPIAGTGTITVTLSESVAANWRFNVDYFTGAHQITPCPTADAVTDITATNVYTLTPANMTANDAAVSVSGNTSNNITSVAPNQTLVDNTTSADIGTGYRIGVGSITVTMSDSNDAHSNVAVRVAAAPAGRTAKNTRAFPLGIDLGMNLWGDS